MADQSRNATKKTAAGATGIPRIFIVDDHELLRQGLRDLLTSEGWQVCGEASDESMALKQFRTVQPDLVIVDISLRQGDGLDLVKRLVAADPKVRVLVLSMHEEILYAPRALRAGAMGYVCKNDSAKAILRAASLILDDKLAFSQSVTDRLLSARNREHDSTGVPSLVDSLSDREIEVFELIGNGKSTDQIAEHLRISPKTVHSYRERLKAKLNAKNASELTLMAVHWVVDHS